MKDTLIEELTDAISDLREDLGDRRYIPEGPADEVADLVLRNSAEILNALQKVQSIQAERDKGLLAALSTSKVQTEGLWVRHHGGTEYPNWNGKPVVFTDGTEGIPKGHQWGPFNDVTVAFYQSESALQSEPDELLREAWEKVRPLAMSVIQASGGRCQLLRDEISYIDARLEERV